LTTDENRMGASGTLAITARGGGERWYARASLPAEAVRAAGWAPGERLAAIPEEGCWLKFSVSPSGAIRLPRASGKGGRRHVFEAAVATLGLKPIQFPQEDAAAEAVGAAVRLRVPGGLLDLAPRPRSRKSRGERVAQFEPAQRKPRRVESREISQAEAEPDPAGALIADARRSGRDVVPASVEDVFAFFAESGRRAERIGERLFRLDGQVVNGAALADAANMARTRLGLPRFVLVF
jgi:hypothetical protein